MESLGNSNLGSPCSDFFSSFFFLVQPMIQKIGYFHSFALNTSRASGDIVSSRDTEKKSVWGLGNGKVRRGGGRGVCWQLCSSV